MNTDRSRLEVGVHPLTDPRRDPELRAELEQYAQALTPMWRRSKDRDDFGHALLRIGARLAEQSTVRLDGSARRDALAFFDFLGLPPGPPRPATGVLALVLDPKSTALVHAPARTQVSATTADGEQVTFETESRIRLIPGGIAELYSADPSTDRIDRAPAQITSAQPPTSWADNYRLVTFSNAGSPTVQLSPLAGLQEQDLLEIGQYVYRVKEEADNGVVTLLDALEEPAAAEESATRVTRFRAFDLRNVQRHEFHVGHAELLNLQQPATITIDFSPESLAGELGALDVDFALFGTREPEKDPKWHALDLLGVRGSRLRLGKAWSGTVEETEVGGHKNRWLRARLRTPINGRTSATKPAANLRITVASAEVNDTESTVSPDAQGSPTGQGSSRTILHAAHNGTPLATTGRFHPFGPEPVRFDTFALAAPEALSKKGAKVTMTFGLSDSSMESFGVATQHSGAPTAVSWHGYGVSRNGYLQAIVQNVAGPRWLETVVMDGEGERVVLGTRPPVAVARYNETDLVVLEDREGRWWSGIVQHAESSPALRVPEAWHRLERRTTPVNERLGKLLVAAAPDTMEASPVVLVDVGDGVLHTCVLNGEGRPPDTDPWVGVKDLDPTGRKPLLSAGSSLHPVQGSDWPRRPKALEVLVRDDKGVLWIGSLASDPGTQGFTVGWTPAEKPAGDDQAVVPAAHPEVVPAATRYVAGDGTEHVWVAFATASEDGLQEGLCGLDLAPAVGGGLEVNSIETARGIGLTPNSALHTHPNIRGVAGFPAVVGVVGSVASSMELVIWQWRDTATTAGLPGPTTSSRPYLVRSADGPEGPRGEVLLPGTGERLFRARLSPPRMIEYSLHDHVEMRSEGIWAPDRLYVAKDFDDPGSSREVNLEDVTARIYVSEGNNRYLRVYETDPSVLAAGDSIRFLRLYQTEVDGKRRAQTFSGARPVPPEPVDPESPRRDGANAPDGLQLAKDDEYTRVGSRIVIGQASYAVTGLDPNRVATLNAPVAGDSFQYHVADRHTEDQEVTTGNLGTLARLRAESIAGKLYFPAPAVPRGQPVLRSVSSRDRVWAQLAEPWEAQPPNATLAVIAEDLSWGDLARARDYRNPELSWEYFDGEAWQKLVAGFVDGTGHLSATGNITFDVPPDLTTTEIGGKEAYWIRARLIGGDYGRPTYRVTSVEQGSTTTQTVVVDTSELNPPEIVSVEASFSGPKPALPESVLVENNGGLLDQTQAATVPTATFELFQGAAALDGPDDTGRALFAGLTGPVEAGPFTLFVDAEDQPGRGTVDVDVLTPDGWHRVAVDDATASMRRTGLIRLSLDRTPVPLRLFGKDRIWLRFRAGNDPYAGTEPGRADIGWAPVVRSLLPNAVRVSHATTMGNEVLGSSAGEPATTVYLSAVPVLPDSVELRVREDLSEEESTALEDQHRQQRGTSADARTKAFVKDFPGAPGTWVLWQRVDSLIGQDRDARVYVLEPTTGRVTFGDDRAGRIPPAGRDSIRCFSYQQGGGVVGNVPAWIETKLTSAVAGVETAVLPLGTAGGADSPPPDAVFATAPHQLRHAGRAVAPADVEDLVAASAGDILRARCLRPDVPGGPLRVSVVVRDRTTRRPQPTYAQRNAVVDYLREVGWGGLDQDAVTVDGPGYVPVEVTVQLIARPESWAEVEQAARERLVALFDPEHGGPAGSGWPFGRLPTTTDLLRALHGVHGIERVAEIRITGPGGAPVGKVPPDGMVCAEAAAITVTVSGEGIAS
ncbi:baseplate J/gp47 family protein [Kocuria rosea]|uniref:Uncharacterized protein n=1 Tax=Kocuria rosea subsp. polaris TaxID=136273 RepID=A0A0A6VSC8_KOCRO|nr:baseplate J/gp47 family protein [Kocuria polaris]KHD96664.1 hypothetical protein GY22_14515 [Kocuria polaris]